LNQIGLRTLMTVDDVARSQEFYLDTVEVFKGLPTSFDATKLKTKDLATGDFAFGWVQSGTARRCGRRPNIRESA
jgi:hypothetical protein